MATPRELTSNAFSKPRCDLCGGQLGQEGECAACLSDTCLSATSLTELETPPEVAKQVSSLAGRRPPETTTLFPPGTEIAGRYRVVNLAGRGGMGEVYLAEDLKLQTSVALKFIPAHLSENPVRIGLLLGEVRLARQVLHPNVCRVYDVGEAAGNHFLSMEYIDGEDFSSLLRRVGRLPLERACEVGREICHGLAAIHDLGMLHRDLKPSNIMLDGQGKVRLTDFGLAALDGTVHGDAVRNGTPHYMAPEQRAGTAVTTASDLYALGLILYELFTGHRALELHHLGPEAPQPILEWGEGRSGEEIGGSIRKILQRCIARDPTQRPGSAQDIAAALREAEDPALRTVLRSDLVDPRHLAAVEAGDQRALEIFARHQRLVRLLVDTHHGSSVDSEAGLLLLFDRPGDAVRFTLDYQQELADLAVQSTTPLRARTGIHFGEVSRRRNTPQEVAQGARPVEIEGPTLSIAQQLMTLAEEGRTLLTRVAFDIARQSMEASRGLDWQAHGEYAFEAAGPLEVCEVGVQREISLVAPENTAEAVRLPGHGVILGWRPALGLELPGRVHWVMEKPLGEGGFGEVWLARHLKTQERRVFKFCFELSRLRALEREITLFRLLKEELGERQDIVRILDWNFGEAPYFIESEYTAGGDLTEWAEARGGLVQVSLETRLELIAQVAEALAAAHSVGVLHKDIKPQNVLVHESSGRSLARLADFGIGLLTDTARLEKAGITILGLTEEEDSDSVGTPLYRAPELMEGRAATVQADIYALGVLLYQSAVGDFCRALAPGWQRDISDPILCEDIASAVEGRPDRRLGSAAQLADLLRSQGERRRLRQTEERSAKRQVRWQRLRKLGAAVTAVVLFFALLTWRHAQEVAREAERANVAAERAREEAERANREADAVREVAQFMTNLFADSDPLHVGQNIRDVTGQQLLDLGALKLETELMDRPAIRAKVLNAIGGVYRSLGLYDRAEPLLLEGLEVRETSLGENHPEVSESLNGLGLLLKDLSRFEESEALHRRALAIDEASYGPDHPKVALDLDHLAGRLRALDRLDEAEPLYWRALEINEASYGPNHPEVAMNVNNLALLMMSTNRQEQAAPLYHRAIQIYETQFGQEHPLLAKALNNLAGLYLSMGRPGEAEPIFRRTLAIKDATYGPDHPEVARAFLNLASLLRDTGRPEEALPMLRRVVEIRQQNLGSDHPRVAAALSNLAGVLASLEQLEEAADLYRRALDIKQSSYGPHHQSFARTLHHQGRFFELTGQLDAAESNYRRALAILEDKTPDHPWTLETRTALAALTGSE